MRRILAVSSDDWRVILLACDLAHRHDAQLTVIVSWRPSRCLSFLSQAAWCLPPVSRQSLIEDAEQEAAARAHRALRDAPCGIVVRCKRGVAAVVAASEIRSGGYDALVIDPGWRVRYLLGAFARRSAVELLYP